MRSIRLFLLAGILAVMMLTTFIAALRGYQSSMQQADTLFDNELLNLAYLVENLDTDNLDVNFRLGNNIAFQIWQGDSLIAASSHAPHEAIAAHKPGFDYANFDEYRWRTYSRQEAGNGRWVIVAERTDLRYELAENVVLESIVPILLSVPVIGLLIWAVITVALRPLTKLSRELKQKAVNDLAPLSSLNSRLELEQVIQSVNGFTARLQSTLDREKRFSADAAHELRTPISALKIQLYNLQSELQEEPESLKELQAGIERMQHLVEQLLSLYRMTPEQFAANTRTVDLYEIAQEVLARHYAHFEEKQQHIELEGESVTVTGDSFALDTMLSNLLSNACKFTPEGGAIRVVLKRDKGEVVLRVEDNGPGIPAKNPDRVFERFYRVESSDMNPGVPGCGLGLAIVKHVAGMHHAGLHLPTSSFGTGFAVEISFPADGGNS